MAAGFLLAECRHTPFCCRYIGILIKSVLFPNVFSPAVCIEHPLSPFSFLSVDSVELLPEGKDALLSK